MFIYGAKTICVLSGLWLKWCFIACYIDDANYSIPALQTFFFKKKPRRKQMKNRKLNVNVLL